MDYKEIPTELNEVWSECIRMHKDISENPLTYKDYGRPKITWLEKNGYDYTTISHQCFFCQYAKASDPEHQSSPFSEKGCQECPGVLVDPSFNCLSSEYDYACYDSRFVNELEHLNKQRLE
jgi:hypothetical protein